MWTRHVRNRLQPYSSAPGTIPGFPAKENYGKHESASQFHSSELVMGNVAGGHSSEMFAILVRAGNAFGAVGGVAPLRLQRDGTYGATANLITALSRCFQFQRIW
jgi:hypothetical protein